MVQDSVSSLYSRSVLDLATLRNILILLLVLEQIVCTDFTDNTCTFKVDGNLFSLTYLNQNKQGANGYYNISYNDSTTVFFNFCQPFVPMMCSDSNYPSAYSYVVTNTTTNGSTSISCTPYTSNSKSSYFIPSYTNTSDQNILNLTMSTQPSNLTLQNQATFLLYCSSSSNLSIFNISGLSSNYIEISGLTPQACPVFQLSSLWEALSNNKLIFGIVLFVIGFIMLFYGILMTHLMIFLTAYFLTFAVLTGIFTAFLTPDSSTVAIYFSLLFILFLSTLIAYGLTRLVNVSIFFIGAFFGFILAAIINTIFSKVFGVYSVWSLVFFEVALTIPFGLLTFKYSQQIIILSTSLTGSYLIVRPFSWIFGGFPNEFTLYEVIGNGQLQNIPWTFFIYVIFILGIFALGALYQLQKLKQRNNTEGLHTSFLPESVQNHLDRIHQQVEKLISKYKPEDEPKEVDYQKMNEMAPMTKEKQQMQGKIQSGEGVAYKKQRKSKENDF